MCWRANAEKIAGAQSGGSERQSRRQTDLLVLVVLLMRRIQKASKNCVETFRPSRVVVFVVVANAARKYKLPNNVDKIPTIHGTI